jgi:hypothetical protein
VVPAPNTADPVGGASSRPAASGASATPTRTADMMSDYVPHPDVLRGQDYGIVFLRSAKTGQRNEAKYAKYCKANTTRQYFALGGSAADWRYDLHHRYVRFTDADLQQRTNSLLELRTLSDDSLVKILGMIDADGASVDSPTLDTPVSGGDKPYWSGIASQALHYVSYFAPEQVTAKLSKWIEDPGVQDSFYKKQVQEFESVFHMSPEEMGETATPSNAAEQLFGNTADYDEEIEEMLMFNCLHGDYQDIDLHLYELQLNGDDGAQLATPKMLKVDEAQLVCLRGVDVQHRAEYIKAISKELTGLLQLGTFAIVRDNELSTKDKSLPAKFVLKIKYLADGSLDKYKARLVALGYMARAGIDFFATWSPMASLTAIRLIFSIAVHYNTCILHADVPNAFCQGDLDTRTLLRFPKGVSLEDDEGNSSVIVLLRKALYGLRQSPQLFNKLLNELLTSCGLQRCEQEACIYKYFDALGWVLIGCEVDDLIVTGTNEKKIAELQKVFKDKWNVEQWGDIHTFLGMRCQYNRSEGELKLDVEQKIKDMLKRFPELAKLPYKTVPLQPSQVNKELKVGDIKPLTAIDEYLIKEYPKIIGTMIYIAITARPDIAYAVGKLSRGMHQPNKLHCDMLKDVVGYLRNTISLPLRFTRKPSKISFLFAELNSGDAVLSEFHNHSFVEGEIVDMPLCKMHPDPLVNLTDSSYAPPNEKNRRSVSGRCHFHLGNLISWRSKLQPLTAASTHEAELIAMASCSDESIWLRSLLLECGFVIPDISGFYVMPKSKETPTDHKSYAVLIPPSPVYGDNLGSIFTSNNPETSGKNKHLDVRFFKHRDYVKSGKIRVKFIGTKDNVSDFFTKALLRGDFLKFRSWCMNECDMSEIEI